MKRDFLYITKVVKYLKGMVLLMIKNAAVIIILFLTNMLQAITGFAGTLLAMPPVIRLIGADQAKALLNAIAQISSLMIVLNGKKYINWWEFFKIFIFMIAGMVIGIRIYSFFPLDILLKVYGCVIILVALYMMLGKKEIRLSMTAGCTVILIAGIIHGMFVSGGALLVIYAAAALKNKDEFRTTLAMIWLSVGFYMTGTQVAGGHFTPQVIMLLIIGTAAVFLGTAVGIRLLKKISKELFMKITYVLLIISGIMAIV